MSIERNKFAANLSKTPVGSDCVFRIGDTVTFTNEYGVEFSGLKVIGFDDGTHALFKYGNHIYLNTDAWWYPHADKELVKEEVN